MLIDRDVRFSLLATIEIIKMFDDWVTVKQIVDYLENRMMRRYDRRSIYKHLDILSEFEWIDTKYIRHNTKMVKWRCTR